MGHIFRDTANTKIRNGQACSRPGCGSRVNSPKGSQTGSSEKSKSLRPSTRSFSSGKEANGSSSRTFLGTSNPGKRILRPRKTLCSQSEAGSSETSTAHDEPKISNLVPPPENIQRRLQAEVENVESGDVTPMEVGSSSVTSSTRSRRNFHPKPGLRGQEVKSTGPVTHTGTNRYGLRNLRCNSISNVVPAGGCSSSDSTLNRRKDIIKKRNCEGESSSSARVKNISGPSFEGRNAGARTGISFSDPRRSRNTPHRDRPDGNVASVRTRRTVSGQARGRFSGQGNANPVVPNVSHSIIPPSSRSGDRNAPGVSHHSSVEAPLSCPSSYIIPGTISDELYGVPPVSPSEHGITRSPIIREGFRRRYNMDGIAELLLALERIEQDVELTHEQIRMLESNLFPIGLHLHDQHRDMRLDIDNMSYEELLALEERMGTVSTALTEEALSECLKRSSYQPSDDAAGSCNEHKEDTKCSICQDEYLVADEVGSLKCEHKYHVVCIQQWLRLKNWCPICKALVGPSNLSTSSH